MRFENLDRDLLIDERTNGFLDYVQNADYALFAERDAAYYPVERIRQIITNVRYKGIRYQAMLKIVLEENDVITMDRFDVKGDVTVEYIVARPELLVFLSSEDLKNGVLARVRSALNTHLGKLNENQIRELKPDNLKEDLNRKLQQLTNGEGYSLKITDFAFFTAMDKLKEKIELEEVRRQMETRAETQRAWAMLQVEHARLLIEAEQVERIKEIDLKAAEHREQILLNRITELTKLPREYAAAAIVLMDPGAGDALARIMQAHIDAAGRGSVLELMKQYLGLGFAPGSFTKPIFSPDPAPAPPLPDPIRSNLERNGYKVVDVNNTGNSARYLVKAQSYYIELELKEDKVARARWGTNQNQLTNWPKGVNPDPVKAIETIVSALHTGGS